MGSGIGRGFEEFGGSSASDRPAALGGRGPAGRGASLRQAADAGLARWMAELAADAAARERARAHWLSQAAREEGTFAGVLADLAERGRPVLVRLHNGRLHRGTARVIGRDFAVLTTSGGQDVLVALAAIASIRTLPGEPETSGDRLVAPETSLADALGALGEERPRVLVVGLDAGSAVSGELRAVGRDLLTVRLDGDGGTAYLALDSVAEISLDESG